MAKGLLIVDAQNDFMDFDESALPVPGATSIINPLKDYLCSLPFEPQPIITTQDWHTPDHVEYDPDGNPFPKHCVQNTWGAELVYNPTTISGPGDRPASTYHQIYKNEFDMWAEAALPLYTVLPNGVVHRMVRDKLFSYVSNATDTFEVMGVAADVCVYFAVQGLLDRGFKVEIKNSLTRGIFKTMEEVVEENWKTELEAGQLKLLDT